MTIPSAVPQPTHQKLSARLAIASGLCGFLSFACLIAYLRTAAFLLDDSIVMPPTARLLLNTDFIAAALQALFLLPLALWSSGLGHRGTARSAILTTLGVTGLSLVAITRLLPMLFPSVSDIVFMLPTGLVGLWLLILCWPPNRRSFRPLTILGLVAALALIGVTLNFAFTGASAIFTHGPFAYATNVPFHIGLAFTGTPAFILFPLWSILTGRRLLQPPSP